MTDLTISDPAWQQTDDDRDHAADDEDHPVDVMDDISLKMVTAAVMIAADFRDASSPEQRVIWDQVHAGVPVPTEYEWVRDRCRSVLVTMLARLDGAGGSPQTNGDHHA